jgi:hypothetical protein
MALGDGIRRNFAKITEAERGLFVKAVKTMHDTLKFSDGHSFFFKLQEAHEIAHDTSTLPLSPPMTRPYFWCGIGSSLTSSRRSFASPILTFRCIIGIGPKMPAPPPMGWAAPSI